MLSEQVLFRIILSPCVEASVKLPDHMSRITQILLYYEKCF